MSEDSPTPEENPIFCMHCGTRNVNVDYACDRCGERVYVPDPDRPPPLGFMSCANCSAANESHASYCATCGTELDHSTRISPAGAAPMGTDDGDEERRSGWGSASRSGFGGRRGEDEPPMRGGDVPIRRSSQWGLPRRARNQRRSRRPIPQEVRRWNWSAFILGPIWGIWHRIWWSAVVFLPLLPFLVLPRQIMIAAWVLVAIYLGFKGNELAWRARRWESSDQFLALQQRWSTVSVIFAIFVLLVAITFILAQ